MTERKGKEEKGERRERAEQRARKRLADVVVGEVLICCARLKLALQAGDTFEIFREGAVAALLVDIHGRLDPEGAERVEARVAEGMEAWADQKGGAV